MKRLLTPILAVLVLSALPAPASAQAGHLCHVDGLDRPRLTEGEAEATAEYGYEPDITNVRVQGITCFGAGTTTLRNEPDASGLWQGILAGIDTWSPPSYHVTVDEPGDESVTQHWGCRAKAISFHGNKAGYRATCRLGQHVIVSADLTS